MLNPVSFAEGIQINFGNENLKPVTLIGIDVYQLRHFNRMYGFERADQLLRWLEIALRDEMGSTVYRIAGEAFVIVRIGDSGTVHDSQAEQALRAAKAAGKNKTVAAPMNARG